MKLAVEITFFACAFSVILTEARAPKIAKSLAFVGLYCAGIMLVRWLSDPGSYIWG